MSRETDKTRCSNHFFLSMRVSDVSDHFFLLPTLPICSKYYIASCGFRNSRPILKEIKHSEEKNIVLECSVDILSEVLTQAQQVGVMGSSYNYIITNLVRH